MFAGPIVESDYVRLMENSGFKVIAIYIPEPNSLNCHRKLIRSFVRFNTFIHPDIQLQTRSIVLGRLQDLYRNASVCP